MTGSEWYTVSWNAAPMAPHATHNVLRMDFAPSSRLAKKQQVGPKQDFVEAKGGKSRTLCMRRLLFLFSKCHAVLTKGPQLPFEMTFI